MNSTAPVFGFASSPSNQPRQQIDDSTPFVAASDGDLQLLQQSLTHLSLNVNIADSNGLTPLHSSSSYSQLEIMRWLFTQNANVNARDNDGDTPLHHCDDVEPIKVLIQEGKANYTIKNEEGNTVLEAKEEELREYYASTRDDEMDSDDEDDVDNLKKIIKYLKEI
jgi:ankyrin repeat protein